MTLNKHIWLAHSSPSSVLTSKLAPSSYVAGWIEKRKYRQKEKLNQRLKLPGVCIWFSRNGSRKYTTFERHKPKS